MLTERQIHHASGKYARENHEGELTRDDFRAGATWANEYNMEEIEQLIEDKKYLSLTISNAAEWSEKQSAEIAELVAALKHLNGVCRDNFGIGDPQVIELLKKYEK